MAFIPVVDLHVARSFYADGLGLRVTEEDTYAVVLDAGGSMLRLTKVDALRPQPFTIAGWEVSDMEASIEALEARGIALLRHEGIDQDASGIWSTPGGDQIVWFADPDGNTLSLTRFAR
jgi:catechol-2,3-dioxygenase